MSIIDELIFDRTQADLVGKTDKAYISYIDLNRIEEATRYISNYLNENGYKNNVDVKTNWEMSDIRTVEECLRMKMNYEIIKNIYPYRIKTTPNFEWATIKEANEIEKILVDIDYLITRMILSFRECGTFNSGGMEGLI